MIVTNWQAWLDEKYGPKKETFRSKLLECAIEASDELQKEFDWESHSVSVTPSSVHLSFVISGSLYYVMVPVRLAAMTLCISRHLRKGVVEVLELYPRPSKKPQDSQTGDCEES